MLMHLSQRDIMHALISLEVVVDVSGIGLHVVQVCIYELFKCTYVHVTSNLREVAFDIHLCIFLVVRT